MDISKNSHLLKGCAHLPGDLAALKRVNDDHTLLSLQHDAVRKPVTNRHIHILPNFQHLHCGMKSICSYSCFFSEPISVQCSQKLLMTQRAQKSQTKIVRCSKKI